MSESSNNINLFKTPSPETSVGKLFDTKEFLVKRDDLIHPYVSGNKWRKLRLHLEKARLLKSKTVVTVGGAFSNHIIATAIAAKNFGLDAVGIIRGEEADLKNPTLAKAIQNRMQIIPISREEYKARHEEAFRKSWCQQFESAYWVPEGGSGFLGVQGCMDIIKELNHHSDIIVCSAGTGTTAAGIALALKENQSLWVFPALEGDFMNEEIQRLIHLSTFDTDLTSEIMEKVNVFNGYARRGFGKVDEELKAFVIQFYHTYQIPLDLLYTAKAIMGLKEELLKIESNQKSVTFIHTGGLQGNEGFGFSFRD